jgi:DNA primase
VRSKEELLEEARTLGVEPPRLYELGFTHNNCLHPETRFITDQGMKSLHECLGRKVRVLGRGGGWRDATVESFGQQPTHEIKLKRYGDEKTVVATADHLWPVRKAAGRTDYKFRTTGDLSEGDRIAGMYGHVRHNVTPSAIGIMAGFTFGDGTAPSLGNGQIQPARAYLCGDKDKALLPYFSGCRTKQEPDKLTVLDLPRSWKQPPPLDESQSYLYGWLAGYFAADGSVRKGSATISSAVIGHIEVVKDVAARLGIATGRIRTEHRRGYGSEPSPLHRVALLASTLRENFFLLPEHRARFTAALSQPRPADWTVVSVKPTGRVEEVMCAVVPDGHLFTLEDNVLTHNCGGTCVRAGQRQWKHLLDVLPERYAYAQEREEELRQLLGDVSVLRDRRGRDSRPLPLSLLRER